MFNAVKRIAGSAPIWAWIVMVVCAVVLVVGLIVSSNRTAPTSDAAAAMTPTSSTPLEQPATLAFMEDAKAHAAEPRTIVLLGDSTGAARDGWAPKVGTAISQTLQRPMATKFWNTTTNDYGAMVGLGDGPNGPIGFWNGSASGKDANYAFENLDKMIPADASPDLIMLNFGHTQDPKTALAEQLQPLIAQLRKEYPNADLVAIKQSPAQGKNTGEVTAGFASAMDAEGIQVIDVYSAFPTDDASLAPLLKDTVNPSPAGQEIWTTTVLKAFEVQA
ncbi:MULTISPECIES: SGNH/GDSL hydrolase family protein [Gordonia]|uniref:SGNH/GDSL hydrolase family protein n=1 Tax=Gordonia amicalis TaxID=89053 RepID=A0ABU4DKI9_9ACTN|nr:MULTISPECIES: SGNH/GDSL hydrolase family protein [Gordonia]ATD69816.1 hypothetical protein CNO18_05535 [Gordonia sp. 1D]MDJ0455345.1 SGNH/GDSL hydrolase family protein [Gordonia amicalis]MDV6310223.1 SGNH/GDSL hydrolase family protein [Gordonia amicalis]MDV7078819.1 SGNH/GDSL hydrolase family protein [Gordonia amicalis]UOG21043.1 SGNH/GDSL hydrolase family protein [Gordonia amicalis]